MKVLVSGSIAYDRIMDFPGRFADHILPDKLHILNVCFMINGLKENFGGTAGNIAYCLALMDVTPTVIASAGRDFGPYSEWLKSVSIPVDNITVHNDVLTACAYITTDKSDNQITAFNPGAMNFKADPFDFGTVSINPEDTIAIVAPGNIDDMLEFTRMYKDRGIRYIFDPGQSLPVWNGAQLREMIDGSWMFISNDYELELTMTKADINVDDIGKMTKILVTTRADQGSIVFCDGVTIEVPAVEAKKVCDPTGAGDAYRAGFIKGLSMPGGDLLHAARMGSTAAAFVVEVYGTQNYKYDRAEFNRRFEAAFGKSGY
jgi:adenosine kinase